MHKNINNRGVPPPASQINWRKMSLLFFFNPPTSQRAVHPPQRLRKKNEHKAHRCPFDQTWATPHNNTAYTKASQPPNRLHGDQTPPGQGSPNLLLPLPLLPDAERVLGLLVLKLLALVPADSISDTSAGVIKKRSSCASNDISPRKHVRQKY